MLVAVDVDYRDDYRAVAAGAVFRDWNSGTIEDIVLHSVADVRPYVPGRFFERELPCILAVLEKCPKAIEAIIIDGYVHLGDDRRDGLGAHLYRALKEEIPVVGIAKSRFHDTPSDVEVLRGGSTRPLYVTSVGMTETAAKQFVLSMHGEHRIPTVIAAADRACRTAPYVT